MSSNESSGNESDGQSFQCPTCERSFGTECGMKVHHAKIHGESIAGVETECDNCGETFRTNEHRLGRSENVFCDFECKSEFSREYYPEQQGDPIVDCYWCGESTQIPRQTARNERHFCSKDCLHSWRGSDEYNTEEKHPNWKGGQVKAECDSCGEQITITRHRYNVSERHFCTQDCQNTWLSEHNSGQDHPSYAKVVVSCHYCNTEKLVQQSKKKSQDRHFCDTDCFDEWRSETIGGENHHHYNQVDVPCAQCDETIQVKPSVENSRDRNFCDRECYSEWCSENRSGEDNPAWKGGKIAYGGGWTSEKREAVRNRDGLECRYCSMGQYEHFEKWGTNLHVHHITPARKIDDPKKRNRMDNLETVCQNCHTKVERIWPLRPAGVTSD